VFKIYIGAQKILFVLFENLEDLCGDLTH